MTSAAEKADSDVGLVPLRDRVLYLQAVRVVLAIVVIGYSAWTSSALSVPVTLAWSVGYLLLTTPSLAFTRAQRSYIVPVFAGTLLIDGVYLALVTYGANRFGSPLQYAVAVHIIATTLLGSFRTGVKLAFWHSLLVCVTYQLLQATSVVPVPPDARNSAIALIGVLWAVTLATATFGSVNERELRHRNVDLQDLARLSIALEGTDSPESVADVLLGFATDVLRVRRGIFVAVQDGVVRSYALKGVALEAAMSEDPAGDVTIQGALVSRRSLQLTHLLADDDRWLTAVMPDAKNVLVFPMHADSQPVGVLVAEYGLRRSARVERRAVAIVEQFVSHAALALANAWLVAKIRAQAATDGLTGVANRRALDAAVDREISRTQRDGTPLSLIIIDLDHFKRLNDEYGHQAGDDALRMTSSVIAQAVRAGDFVARYGGEEFAVLLPATSLAFAIEAAERLRIAIQGCAMRPGVTASLGVATTAGSHATVAELVHAADLALYEAKRRGRNQVAFGTDAAGLTA